MYFHSGIFWLFSYFVPFVYGHRDLFEQKCKRACNTEHGTFNCWKITTDGFSYGLSAAMIDYCQTILQIRQMTNNTLSWYNISSDILIKQIDKYNFDKRIHQLSKENITQIAVSLLNKCFYASSSISSVQPKCPSCSVKQVQFLKEWRLTLLILVSTCSFLIFVIFLLYAIRIHCSYRSYQTIN